MCYNESMSSKKPKTRLQAYQDFCAIEGTGCWWHEGDDTNVYETPPRTVPDSWEFVLETPDE
jgi:hypothetical protein